MSVDNQQIMDEAEKLGKMVAEHPAVHRYRQAQKTLTDDQDATRLLNEFNRQLMNLARQEESGLPVTDAQRHQLENLQGQLASHLKIKALNVAQVEFVDLMRRISDTIRKYVSEGAGAGAAGAAGAGVAGGAGADGAPPHQPAQGAGPRLVI